VQTRRATDPAGGNDLGALDAAAIARVRDEIRPDPRDADELHDALLTAGFLTAQDLPDVPADLLEALIASGRACWLRGDSPCDGGTVPVPGGLSPVGVLAAAERLAELRAIHPHATATPDLTPPPSRLARTWTRQDAIVEILRGRVSLTGPITASALGASLGVSTGDADGALAALESEGLVLRGRFTAGEVRPAPPPLEHSGSVAHLEWCDRTLLARIHLYTLNRLRAEIEPVSPADFMRFLFRWQHVESASRLSGPDGIRALVALLDGYEVGARAWERSVLPVRLDRYEPAMLDLICLAGEAGWGRLSADETPAATPAGLVPATPVAIFLREHAPAWRSLRTAPSEDRLSADARLVLATLRAKGALFFGALLEASAFDADRLTQALGALVACGLATSDGFSGLRALVRAARGRPVFRDRRTAFAGRWTAVAAGPPLDREEAVRIQAAALLRRYGIICRRLEARGEIRGGRFVHGLSGEQFALPEAVERMREVRRRQPDGALMAISAADPLNLAGIVTTGDRVRAVGRTRIVYRDGVPLAVMEGAVLRELAPVNPSLADEIARLLRVRRAAAVLA
jgi:ATP-dependent Lhr-like helicase